MIFLLCFTTCNSPEKKNIERVNSDSEIADTCNNKYIRQINHPKTDIIYNSTVVVEFFDMWDLLKLFHDGKIPSDSIPEKFITRRESVYEIHDITGMYAHLKSYIVSNGIKRIDGNINDSILTFYNGQNFYEVELSSFKELDGVILFKTGSLPKLWPGSEGFNCKDNLTECEKDYFENN